MGGVFGFSFGRYVPIERCAACLMFSKRDALLGWGAAALVRRGVPCCVPPINGVNIISFLNNKFTAITK